MTLCNNTIKCKPEYRFVAVIRVLPTVDLSVNSDGSGAVCQFEYIVFRPTSECVHERDLRLSPVCKLSVVWAGECEGLGMKFDTCLEGLMKS